MTAPQFAEDTRQTIRDRIIEDDRLGRLTIGDLERIVRIAGDVAFGLWNAEREER